MLRDYSVNTVRKIITPLMIAIDRRIRKLEKLLAAVLDLVLLVQLMVIQVLQNLALHLQNAQLWPICLLPPMILLDLNWSFSNLCRLLPMWLKPMQI
ncbi:hypothetical protein LINPERPRIM_LOCUS2654 [Linum perenne]